MGSVNWRKRGNRYQVAWRLDDGSQGAKTVATKDEALDLVAEKRLEMRPPAERVPAAAAPLPGVAACDPSSATAPSRQSSPC